MKRFIPLFCFCAAPIAYAQEPPRVPSVVWLADVKLQIAASAKPLIQQKIDSLTRNKRAFQALSDQANLYAPIVERILKEEGVPLDFKYMVIQESGLIADAISTSNAVGFWQFKNFTALEMNLKIDEHVDERMHIGMATRGAARYLKSHNEYLDNWAYSLLAYCTGRGHVQRSPELNYEKYKGVKKMRIDGRTHFYILHFIAHKLVFEAKMGQERHPELYLEEYHEVHGKSLSEIAKELKVDKDQLQAYNKWLKRAQVPHDTQCAAIVPMKHQQAPVLLKATTPVPSLLKPKFHYAQYWHRASEFPVVKQPKRGGKACFNGLWGAIAQEGATLKELAEAANLPLKKFMEANDLEIGHSVVPGQVYYHQPKHYRAGIHLHIARPGESWWSIAQKYGVKKQELLKKNRLRAEVPLQPGRVVWLRFMRPRSVPVAYEYQETHTPLVAPLPEQPPLEKVPATITEPPVLPAPEPPQPPESSILSQGEASTPEMGQPLGKAPEISNPAPLPSEKTPNTAPVDRQS